MFTGPNTPIRIDQAHEGNSIPVVSGHLVLNALPVKVKPVAQGG